MIIIHRAHLLIDYLGKQRSRGLKIGFVPTMGALHQAHISLINYSATLSDITVCSIFVNPTQFNDQADYNKYPKTLETDIHKLSTSDVSVIYAPAVSEVYREGVDALEHYDLGYLETTLEGRFRPGHFQGVCQVMSRLLRTVEPDYLFMGEKDYQQCMVIRKLLTYLNQDILLVTRPTIREHDGLAMSSRNTRLTAEQRKQAPLIYQTLSEIKRRLVPGNLEQLKQDAVVKLTNGGFRVEYVEIADAASLAPVTEWRGDSELIALTAAFLGDVRLIDNMLLND
jgi:pantoate--beta-alanine ligase